MAPVKVLYFDVVVLHISYVFRFTHIFHDGICFDSFTFKVFAPSCQSRDYHINIFRL